jgi:hypothetical protein
LKPNRYSLYKIDHETTTSHLYRDAILQSGGLH